MCRRMTWYHFMKIKILLVGLLCLIISSTVEAKQKPSTKQEPNNTEQIFENDESQEEKPKMCYTHLKKWHPCPVQPKKKDKKEKSQ